MKKAITYMMLGAGTALVVEKAVENPMPMKRMARRTMRMFRSK